MSGTVTESKIKCSFDGADAAVKPEGIDGFINAAFEPASECALSIVFYSVEILGNDVPLILLWLVAAACFFTVYLGFINFRYFKHSIDVLRGKYDDPDDDGEIDSWQALAASLSGTVGLGNIAGVAIAISLGGPGAMIWMIVMGFISMMTKFVEVMLGVQYRHHPDKNHPEKIYGGPMYYLRDGFANRGWPKLGKVLSIVFAVTCILGTIGAGPLFQTNQAYQQVLNVSGGDASFFADKAWLFGVIMVFLTGIVILGGIKSIANVASKIVPLMGVIYILGALIVIGMHFDQIPTAIVAIFSGAFSVEAGWGAFLGTVFIGVQRAVFSNEAGIGTAAIVYAPAKAKHAASQGFASMLGPFIDTVVVCSTTALVIVITGVYLDAGEGMKGIELTSAAFASGIPWFPYVLAVAAFLFAYSTLITWSYYLVQAFSYICGENDYTAGAMKVVYLLFIVVGASATLGAVVDFTDAMIFAMAIPNIIGMYVFAREVKRDTKKYIEEVINKDISSEVAE
jgi:AGCS family alanine or glycine:cation symporter